MENYKKELVFIDAENHKARLDIEITHRNGYPEFTMSGQFMGGFGQVIDHIRPVNDAQKDLMQPWSDEEFAQDMAEQIGAIHNDAKCPNNCIDWTHAAKELMYDYSEHDGHYFRNL